MLLTVSRIKLRNFIKAQRFRRKEEIDPDITSLLKFLYACKSLR
jgi:hypothetical protein